MLVWNFTGDPSNSASNFFKIASAGGHFLYEDDFDVVITYNYKWLLDMLDYDNIMSRNVFEAVQKISTNEKDYHKCSLRVAVSIFITTAYSVEKVGYYKTFLE